MIIAVPYLDGEVFQHFGHSESFKLYEATDGRVVSSEVVATAGQGHGALAAFLKERSVSTLICGGIGGGARVALKDAHIAIYGGVKGSADAAVAALLDGTLRFDPNATCSHHDSSSGSGHSCGSHGCGGHRCGGSCGAEH